MLTADKEAIETDMRRNWEQQPLTTIRKWAAFGLAALMASSAALSPCSAAVPTAHSEAKPASAKEPTEAERMAQRRNIFEQTSTLTGIPWYYLAAIDQYERTLTKARPKARPVSGGLLSIYIPPSRWSGALNPDEAETSLAAIRHFGGIGRDGDGDGKADRLNDADVMYTIASHVLAHGTATDDFAIGLWEYYRNTRAVQRVMQFSRLYDAFDRLDLFEHAFPLPVRANYSYRSTWGARRGWGGYRIHEGTDIFAGYGVPVRSTCYGIVEVKGWNPFGGWRIGIRDLDNVYHYYAHLSGFERKVAVGDIVTPGQTIGWVGSSGYGKPGTSGKFPPHLHYGVYRDRGLVEWAFDPYPSLKSWEQEEWRKIRGKKNK